MKEARENECFEMTRNRLFLTFLKELSGQGAKGSLKNEPHMREGWEGMGYDRESVGSDGTG